MFTRKTFQYFDQAKKHKNSLVWFEKNQKFYEENVRAPFTELVLDLQKNFKDDLPRIDINPRSITRPLRPKNKVGDAKEWGGGLIKTAAHVTIAEKRTSLFEWNPGIYFQIGEGKDDNFLGLGLYMVSGRQLSLLRDALFEKYEEIDGILRNPQLKKIWGGVLGDKYKRFPKGFDPENPRSRYLWHKQFYMGLDLSRGEVTSKNFNKVVVRDLKAAIPFFKWVRGHVGTYQGLYKTR